MYQDNKKQLIWCQLIHVVLFLFMGTIFSVMYAKTHRDEGCELDGGEACNFRKTRYDNVKHITSYSVQNKFEAIFLFGIATYFADAAFRFIVVLGLHYNRLCVQITGIILTVIVSTFLQTTLMILMPIYRYNTAGIQICDQDDPELLASPCKWFLSLTILVSLVWVASCCTSFAFNKNDYSKEFGYSTRAVQDEPESPNGLGGRQDSNDREDQMLVRENEPAPPVYQGGSD